VSTAISAPTKKSGHQQRLVQQQQHHHQQQQLLLQQQWRARRARELVRSGESNFSVLSRVGAPASSLTHWR
jgi:hypothetical protein